MKANKTELEKAITNAENFNSYDPGDKEDAAVLEALSNAKEVKADANASQATVDAAKEALNKALKVKAAQDKADQNKSEALKELEKAIDKAKSTSTSKCTKQSVGELEKAIETGKSIVKDSYEISIKEIQNATEAINNAIDNLELEKSTVLPIGKTKTNVQTKSHVEKSVTQPVSKTNVKHKQQVIKEATKDKAKTNKAKDLPNTGQELTSMDPKYASLMFAIGGLMMFFRKRKNEDKDNTEK